MNTVKTYILKNKGAILALFVFIAIAFYTGRVTTTPERLIVKGEIETLKNKAGEEYTRVEAYEVSIRELKLANSQLFNEVKKLREKPLTVEQIQTTLKFKGELETKVTAKPESREYNLH